jgi:peptidoglycan/xylan/chitin deacetylase (PgdA/CDA1 family)
MSYTPNPTWADGPGGGTPAEAVPFNHIEAGILDASNRLDAQVVPAQLNRGRATVVATYASGHGWTAAGGWSTSNVNDTSDGRLSGQMLTGTTPGNTGTFPTFTKLSAPAINLTGQCLRVWVKVDAPTNVAAITLRAAASGGIAASNYVSWTALASSGGVYRTNGIMIPPNTWTELSFSLGSAFSAGTPNITAITDYRWIAQDNGTAFTVNFGGITAYPALSARYPNGVACFGFDDCYAGQFSQAMNLFSSFGYTATLFPIIDQIGAGGSYTLTQLGQMANIGWEIAPHAYTLANHSGWNSLSLTQASADVLASKQWIATHGFGLSGVFAYPLGGFNGGFSGAVAPLCQVARTIDSTMLTESLPVGNPLQLRSPAGIGGSGGIGVTTYTTATTGVIALAKAAGALVPMTFHDISSGTSGNINQCSIADLTTLVTAINTAGMAVATYGEVLRYAMLGIF